MTSTLLPCCELYSIILFIFLNVNKSFINKNDFNTHVTIFTVRYVYNCNNANEFGWNIVASHSHTCLHNDKKTSFRNIIHNILINTSDE